MASRRATLPPGGLPHGSSALPALHTHSTRCLRTTLRHNQKARVVLCRSSVRFPASLPLLPFTPQEVLPPGSCKVLRLTDPSNMLLAEELLSSPHQMMVHSAVAPTSRLVAGPGGARLGAGGAAAAAGLGAAGRGTAGGTAAHGGPGHERLGAFEAGGFTFYLSTIVKVIDVRQTDDSGGVLLRVQAEGRCAVKSLVSVRPYFRALVVPLTDDVSLEGLRAAQWAEIRGAADGLRDLMRDVQNLCAKFKSPETANLQRAMTWVDYPHPRLFASSSLLLNSPACASSGFGTASASAASSASPASTSSSSASSSSSSNGLPGSPTQSYDFDDFQPSKIMAKHIGWDGEDIDGRQGEERGRGSSRSGSSSGDREGRAGDGDTAGRDGLGSGTLSTGSFDEGSAVEAPGLASLQQPQQVRVGAMGTAEAGGSASTLSVPAAEAAEGGQGQGQAQGSVRKATLRRRVGAGLEEAGGGGGASRGLRPSLLDLERACRLSMAAIQPLPRATEEEREAVVLQQAAALETQDVVARLRLASQVMGEARGLLAAKCALMSLSSSSSSSSSP